MTEQPPEPGLRAGVLLLVLAICALGVALVVLADQGLDAAFHAYPRLMGWGSAALVACALAASRALRQTVLAYLKILALAAPFIGAMLLAQAGLLRLYPRETADTIFVLAVMAPLTVLLFWVLIFAARKPPAGSEGLFRRTVRRWGALMPVHRAGFFSYLLHFSRRDSNRDSKRDRPDEKGPGSPPEGTAPR